MLEILFKIRHGERLQATVVTIIVTVMNALFIYRLHGLFQQPGFGPYQELFARKMHLAGYDPYVYMTVTDWDVIYEVHRHPLLAFMIWPFHIVNGGLSWITGVNCAQYVIAVPLIACTVYSYLFLYRTLSEVTEISKRDATLLSVMFFSLAYVMLSPIVPDHFTVSMMLLLMTIYITGLCIKRRLQLRWWQSAALFFVTAGVTLSNGIKTLLAGLAVNRSSFFHLRYMLLAVILPAVLLWGSAIWQFHTYTIPHGKAEAKEKMKKEEAIKAHWAQMTPEERKKKMMKMKQVDSMKYSQPIKTGKPLSNREFLRWTDITTPRLRTAYENLLGESLQFHPDYLLEDIYVNRPVFVSYRWWWNYAIEVAIVILTLAGMWEGRKNRLLQVCLLWFAFDMLLHFVLGFSINEIQIVTPHWAFVLPIAIAFLLREHRSAMLRAGIATITTYLLAYNGWLLSKFLLSPIN